MTYSEAIEFKNANLCLIGTTDEKGLNIGKIIIVPSDVTNRAKFFSSFILSLDDEVSILPYTSYPVEVWAIDLEQLHRNNILFHKRLA